MDISIRRAEHSKPRPATTALGFGQYFTDHMFVVEYEPGAGWHSARIQPYGPLAIDPAAAVLQYAQALFEGLKAIRSQDGKLNLFRPDRHLARWAHGSARMCMPVVPPELMLQAVKELVKIDRDWVPSGPNTALYLRPTMIGTEGFLGVRPSRNYMFYVIASPVGAYYEEGFDPVSIWIEDECVRAARGGLGAVKAGANYAASMFAGERAKSKGYAQVLWLDAAEHKYLEEVGTMNVFVQIGETLYTPPLEGSILEGVTRNSILALLRDWKYDVAERAISVDEISRAHDEGRLKEVFGCGTGAVLSPVGELAYKHKRMIINDRRPGPVSQKLFETVTGIQQGRIPDTRGWLVPVT
jgi:branched-chain amino acid aminotransferase